MGNEAGKAEQGRALYAQGHSLAFIGRRLGVAPSTVSGWKRRGEWDGGPEGALHRKNAALGRSKEKAAKLDAAALEVVEQNRELKDWEKVFCLHYSRSFNATQAYLLAKPNVCYKTAGNRGPELAHKPHIVEELARLRQLRSLEMMADGTDVVALHMQIAFADMMDFVSWDAPGGDGGGEGEEHAAFIDPRLVDGRLVSEVRQGRDGITVKLADRHKSLAFLERYFELHPGDRYRREFEERRLRFEQRKAGGGELGDIVFVIHDEEAERLPEGERMEDETGEGGESPDAGGAAEP